MFKVVISITPKEINIIGMSKCMLNNIPASSFSEQFCHSSKCFNSSPKKKGQLIVMETSIAEEN